MTSIESSIDSFGLAASNPANYAMGEQMPLVNVLAGLEVVVLDYSWF